MLYKIKGAVTPSVLFCNGSAVSLKTMSVMHEQPWLSKLEIFFEFSRERIAVARKYCKCDFTLAIGRNANTKVRL